MKLPGYAIRIILVILFFVSAGARFAVSDRSTYTYFKGESAMIYRGMTLVADGGDLDTPTKKSNWPQGYRPARIHAAGLEYLSGHAFRAAKYFSEIDARAFCKRFVVLFFSLTVLTMYALTRRLWGSQGAGLFSALLVALFPPLVEVTCGKSFTQLPFAIVLCSFHILFILGYAQKSSVRYAVSSAAAAFLLLTLWDPAPTYVLAVVFLSVVFSPLRSEQQKWLAGSHLLAFLAAAAVVPSLRSLHAAFSPSAAFLVACCVYSFLPARFAGRARGVLFILIAGAILTVAALPMRAGAEQGFPALKYVFYRFRFLFAKPADPLLLPDTIRHFWSAQHASPSAHALLVFFLPMLFFLPAVVTAVRDMRPHPDQHTSARLVIAIGAAIVACLMFVVDRSTVALAAVAAFPVIGLGAKELDTRLRFRVPFLAAGAFLLLAQLLAPLGGANVAYQISRGLGIAHRDKSSFLWVSLENTDRELVRFVASRTSVSNPFLGQPDVTAVLLSFAGRTSVLTAGGHSPSHAEKRVGLFALFYGAEEPLYAKCREFGVRYVLYSIDFLLDSTRYGPAYIAGVTSVPEDCVAAAMHFAPESLQHFNLVYENDHYRLFRVTETLEPVFATDHPPVYQRDILERNDDTYESFSQRISSLLLAYADAIGSAAEGDYQQALLELNWCLKQAPRFTRARVGLGSALLQLGRAEEARDVLMSVVSYAPDDPFALYHAAYALALLGDTNEATGLLKILYTTTNDPEILNRARLLETLIEQNMPLSPKTDLE